MVTAVPLAAQKRTSRTPVQAPHSQQEVQPDTPCSPSAPLSLLTAPPSLSLALSEGPSASQVGELYVWILCPCHSHNTAQGLESAALRAVLEEAEVK